VRGPRTHGVGRGGGWRFRRPRQAMRGNQVLRIQVAEHLREPVQQAERIIDANLEPVQALRIAAEVLRRMYEAPFGIAVPMLRGRARPPIRTSTAATRETSSAWPGSSSTCCALSRRATCFRSTDHSRASPDDCDSAPPARSGIFGQRAHILVIETKAGEPSGGAAAGNPAVDGRAVAPLITRMRIFVESPFRRGSHELGDHDFDA